MEPHVAGGSVVEAVLSDLYISPTQLQGLNIHCVEVLRIRLVDQLDKFSRCSLEIKSMFDEELLEFMLVLGSPFEHLLWPTASDLPLELGFTSGVGCRGSSNCLFSRGTFLLRSTNRLY